MDKNFRLPGRDPNEMRIMAELARAAVQEALQNGVPIPVVDAGGDPAYGPVPPIVRDGKWVLLQRYATLRPFFENERQETGVYLPAYVRQRFTGTVVCADQYGLRPFIAKVLMIPLKRGADTVCVAVPCRGELTTTEFARERILEMSRQQDVPWMHVRAADAEELEALAQSVVEGAVWPYDLETEDGLAEFSRRLTERFLEDKQKQTCFRGKCRNGMRTGPDGKDQLCENAECFFRGCLALYGPPSDEKPDQPASDSPPASNEASTASPVILGPSGEPVSDTSSD